MEAEVVILKLEQAGWGSLAHGKVFGIVFFFFFNFRHSGFLPKISFFPQEFSLRVFWPRRKTLRYTSDVEFECARKDATCYV